MRVLLSYRNQSWFLDLEGQPDQTIFLAWALSASMLAFVKRLVGQVFLLCLGTSEIIYKGKLKNKSKRVKYSSV